MMKNLPSSDEFVPLQDQVTIQEEPEPGSSLSEEPIEDELEEFKMPEITNNDIIKNKVYSLNC